MDLSQFTGSTEFYRHSFGRIVYTEGIKYLADEAGAYWLIDAIASYQPQAMKNRMLADFQLWELRVANNKAVLTCSEDCEQEPVIKQEIEFTDFPLEYIALYVEGGTLMLRTER